MCNASINRRTRPTQTLSPVDGLLRRQTLRCRIRCSSFAWIWRCPWRRIKRRSRIDPSGGWTLRPEDRRGFEQVCRRRRSKREVTGARTMGDRGWEAEVALGFRLFGLKQTTENWCPTPKTCGYRNATACDSSRSAARPDVLRGLGLSLEGWEDGSVEARSLALALQSVPRSESISGTGGLECGDERLKKRTWNPEAQQLPGSVKYVCILPPVRTKQVPFFGPGSTPSCTRQFGHSVFVCGPGSP